MNTATSAESPASASRAPSRARQVLDYQQDNARPGRPLMMLLGGAATTFVALVLFSSMAYRLWISETLQPEQTYLGLSFLFMLYIFGVFLFSYAYELYDTGKALRLTLIVAFFSLAAMVVVMGALALASKSKSGTVVKGVLTDEETSPLAMALGSLFDDKAGTVRDDDFETEIAEPDVFTIACGGCAQRFTPSPPDAVCPACGRAALASA